MPSSPSSMIDWGHLAERRMKALLEVAQSSPSLRKMGGARAWQVSVQMVNAPFMSRLNYKYRKKDYPTDVLSFVAPKVFRDIRGELGELVICLPVLIRQAAEQGHSPGIELEILLVHGLLHLLGMDHEASRAEAERMHRWEKRLLKKRPGLIARGE